MTESGLEMPPDHMVSQMRSTLDLSSPVIIFCTRYQDWCVALVRSWKNDSNCTNMPSEPQQVQDAPLVGSEHLDQHAGWDEKPQNLIASAISIAARWRGQMNV